MRQDPYKVVVWAPGYLGLRRHKGSTEAARVRAGRRTRLQRPQERHGCRRDAGHRVLPASRMTTDQEAIFDMEADCVIHCGTNMMDDTPAKPRGGEPAGIRQERRGLAQLSLPAAAWRRIRSHAGRRLSEGRRQPVWHRDQPGLADRAHGAAAHVVHQRNRLRPRPGILQPEPRRPLHPEGMHDRDGAWSGPSGSSTRSKKAPAIHSITLRSPRPSTCSGTTWSGST